MTTMKPMSDEPAQPTALHGPVVPDGVREEEFERLMTWAAAHFGVPVALISLIDAGRQWVKSSFDFRLPETVRELAFCNHTILARRPVVVEDALADPRFRDNPMVLAEPRIRFYAGAPVIAPDGCAVGTFCVIDRKPRRFPISDQFMLRQLAGLVVEELIHRHLNLPLRACPERPS